MPEPREELQRIFGDLFADRFRSARSAEGPLGEFLPLHADDVRRISEEAARHGVPLAAAGGGTAGAEELREGVVVNTERMRRFEPRHNGGWAEAEPGVLWLSLDDELRQRGKGLAVYPTSAPRATVGGWLATDGLGVGSFEHGWLHENVLAADVVLPGGEIREVAGRELPESLGSGRRAGIVVRARLRTRRADTDVPFAAAFEDREALLGALARLVRESDAVPAWHVGFLSPAMASLRGLSTVNLMFGVYPGHSFEELGEAFTPAIADHDGERLDSRTSYQLWGERFYPVTPLNPAPPVHREFTTVQRLLASPAEEGVATQGILARSGEVLLLEIENQSGLPRDPASPKRSGRTCTRR